MRNCGRWSRRYPYSGHAADFWVQESACPFPWVRVKVVSWVLSSRSAVSEWPRRSTASSSRGRGSSAATRNSGRRRRLPRPPGRCGAAGRQGRGEPKSNEQGMARVVLVTGVLRLPWRRGPERGEPGIERLIEVTDPETSGDGAGRPRSAETASDDWPQELPGRPWPASPRPRHGRRRLRRMAAPAATPPAMAPAPAATGSAIIVALRPVRKSCTGQPSRRACARSSESGLTAYG